MSQDDINTSSTLLPSPMMANYTRRTASLNAEAALKCLTEASRRMSPSTRAYFSRKRNCHGDIKGSENFKIDLPSFRKLTPTSVHTDVCSSSAVRSLQYDSVSSYTRAKQKNTNSSWSQIRVKPITTTITLPKDFILRRTANLNASACMTALLSPTKKPKVEEATNNGHNYTTIVPAQEDVEIDVVEVDSMDTEILDILRTSGDRIKVEPSVDGTIAISNVASKTSASPVEKATAEKASPLSTNNISEPLSSLVVPLRGEKVKELVEEGIQIVSKTTQRRPSKRSRRENNGWSWIGKPIETVTTSKGSTKRFFVGMRRKSEAIFVRDNTTFWSGKSEDAPFVGKILSFWQETSEMMCTVFWYYQLEDESFLEDELLASQHIDHNPVAAIIEKCYVLGRNEYCRYHAVMKFASENCTTTTKTDRFVYKAKQSLYEKLRTPDSSVEPELVYLCQKSYNYKTGKITGRK